MCQGSEISLGGPAARGLETNVGGKELMTEDVLAGRLAKSREGKGRSERSRASEAVPTSISAEHGRVAAQGTGQAMKSQLCALVDAKRMTNLGRLELEQPRR